MFGAKLYRTNVDWNHEEIIIVVFCAIKKAYLGVIGIEGYSGGVAVFSE